MTGPFSHSQTCTKVHCMVVPLISLDISFAKQRASMLSRCPVAPSSRWALLHFKLRPLALAAWHTGCDRNRASPQARERAKPGPEPGSPGSGAPAASGISRLNSGRAGPCKRPQPGPGAQGGPPRRLRGSLAGGAQGASHTARSSAFCQTGAYLQHDAYCFGRIPWDDSRT